MGSHDDSERKYATTNFPPNETDVSIISVDLPTGSSASRVDSYYSPTTCSICSRTFSNRIEYMNHFEDCLPLICGFCSKSVCDYEMLKMHVLKHHNRFIHQCKFCRQISYDSHSELTHRSLNCPLQGYFECENCTSRFETLKAVQGHSLMHWNDTLLTCSYCAFKTLMKVKLADHEERHLKIMALFECPYCAWGSNCMPRMVQHIEDYHFSKSWCQ